ncbi:helix-hairpin-helix domain-containing protein [Niastella caeni]|uniref:Helix-hairpin-helix domain-containing protein n=1 Tax=Niastella caeni TaxID=2569763 RepID=A0A4S8HYQ8_9BACT|nr:helix-hairpin-helix domain-containing protein [Niastella caeni]THU40877.1 helix-hairpin-helix domain-containing protein [Niastella caeni]
MKWPFAIWLTLQGIAVSAQERQTAPVNEQQLESQAERQEGLTEDDTHWQQLEYWQKHPLNLNEATENDLKGLRLLNDLQISNFLLYRKMLGPLLDVNELQAVPAWDIPVIKQLLPFVTVSNPKNIVERLGERFGHGEQTMLWRFARRVNNSSEYSKTTNAYLGNAAAILFRYKYNFKGLLQYGITGDKDAGEQFFKGAQKNGFDFYSFHFFARKLGIIQSLAIGDFTVGFGQGLIQWQGMAFKKSANALFIKRQGPALQPYNSAGEYNFHRGVGITLQKKRIQCTIFGSFRKLNTNLVIDSLLNGQEYISSIITSGYNRTLAELNDRNNVQCVTAGGALKLANNRSHLGINAVQYSFSKPLQPAGAAYDLFAINGQRWSNYSFDYGYTFRNMHVYGEVAVDKLFNRAMVHGLLASLDPKVDLAIVYRNISSQYQSLFSNAFTENSLPVNENGCYAGLSIRPVPRWKLDVYADIFSFPWLKHQVNAPSGGHEYLVQIDFTPNKYVEIYTRFRHETKWQNMADTSRAIQPLAPVTRLNWRTHISYRLNRVVELRSRVETVWYASNKQQNETGFMFYTDVHVKPAFKPFFFNARIQYIETDGYNSRIYAWENTVLYNFSIPALFNKALRYVINVNYRLMPRQVKQHSKKFNCLFSLSFAQTVYPSKPAVEAMEDAIEAYNKADFKLQIIFTKR